MERTHVTDPEPSPADSHSLSVQRLFVQHQPQLRAFVMGLAPDFATADDVMQEAFLEISRKAAEFALGTNFQAWSRSIAKFKVLAVLRDRQRSAKRLAEDVLEALAASAPLDDDAERHEVAVVRLRTCLEHLAPAARELVRLRYFGEHLPEAIAALRAQSVGAVNVTLSRARTALRTCMERGKAVDSHA
ncbi:MAG: sigma-70 family RNA polymerase sigma factor [Planctomycetes bacterium]|nr:sigma-70 family RNA polymerase sigma factor [Planctomycetota bacterium]